MLFVIEDKERKEQMEHEIELLRSHLDSLDEERTLQELKLKVYYAKRNK